ncbi:MAG: lysophospholipid acyltransferase family protein [Thermoanaerobaculia bacterium]
MTRVRHVVEYAAFRVVEALVRALPHRGARALGRRIGRLAHGVLRRHRRIARENLARALPEIGPEERARTVRACFEHFGLALADTVSVGRFDLVELCRRMDLEGWHHLQEAEARAAEGGVGVFVLSAHLGLWEVAAYPPGIYGGPLHVVGRPLDNPLLDRKLAGARARFGNRPVSKRGAVRPMMKILGRGGRVGILIDQRARPGEGIRVPFFGIPSYTTPVLARIALRTGAPVVPIFGLPRPRGRYRIVLREAIWPEAAEGLEGEEAVAELTRLYLAACEAEIRRHPEMWLWMHRRWKPVPGELAPGVEGGGAGALPGDRSSRSGG